MNRHGLNVFVGLLVAGLMFACGPNKKRNNPLKINTSKRRGTTKVTPTTIPGGQAGAGSVVGGQQPTQPDVSSCEGRRLSLESDTEVIVLKALSKLKAKSASKTATEAHNQITCNTTQDRAVDLVAIDLDDLKNENNISKGSVKTDVDGDYYIVFYKPSDEDTLAQILVHQNEKLNIKMEIDSLAANNDSFADLLNRSEPGVIERDLGKLYETDERAASFAAAIIFYSEFRSYKKNRDLVADGFDALEFGIDFNEGDSTLIGDIIESILKPYYLYTATNTEVEGWQKAADARNLVDYFDAIKDLLPID